MTTAPAVITIPLTRLTVGSRDVGPVTLAVDHTTADVSLDRTVSGGLDAAPSSTTLSAQVFLSLDGGTTWRLLASVGTAGGLIVDSETGPAHTTTITVPIPNPGVARRVKATITVAGASVFVAGTLTVA